MIFQLLNEYAGLSQAEAKDYFDIQENEKEWVLVSRRWLETSTYKAMQRLVQDRGGAYQKSPNPTFYVPKTAGSKPADSGDAAPDKRKIDQEALGIKGVPTDTLAKSPFWTREFKEDEEFRELVESVKKHGIMQPIIVRQNSVGALEIVAGHRRWLAARKAGLAFVPVHVRKLSDEQAYELQLIENVHRKDLSDLEKARMLKAMKDKFGWTHEQLAEKVGKSKSWVSQHLKMLEVVREAEKVHPGEQIGNIEIGELTERQARELLRAPPEKREEILKEAAEKGEFPSAREIQRTVQSRRLYECEFCGLGTRNPIVVDGHYFCSQEHAERAKALGLLQKPKKVEVKVAKPKETPEFRRAVMQPQHSKMELAVLEKLETEGITPIVTDRSFCLQSTTPDFYLPKHNVAIYLDGAPHEGREDRDEKLRELLAEKHGVKVVSIKYNHTSDAEAQHILQHIKEVLEAL